MILRKALLDLQIALIESKDENGQPYKELRILRDEFVLIDSGNCDESFTESQKVEKMLSKKDTRLTPHERNNIYGHPDTD